MPEGQSLTPECDAVVEIADPVELGGVCYRGEETTGFCGTGRTCHIQEGCGRCEAREELPNGSACLEPAECASGSCIGGSCADLKPRGAACAAGNECRGYLECQGDPGAGACADPLGEGDACEFDSECQNGLSCMGDPLRCTLDFPNGSACDRAGSTTCTYLCVFAAPDAATGECGYALLLEGEACAYTRGSPTCLEGAPQRTTSAEGVDTACVCAPLGTAGAACGSDAECESYSCNGLDPLDPTVTGACDPRRAAGQECTLSRNCESLSCGDDGLCAAASACE